MFRDITTLLQSSASGISDIQVCTFVFDEYENLLGQNFWLVLNILINVQENHTLLFTYHGCMAV
jgi:hypothetical protein